MNSEFKILIAMWYDDGVKSFGDLSYEINKKYCDKHGYDIIKCDKRFFSDRHAAWERLPFILKHIKQYDYVVWIDADAHFYITAPPITKLLSLYSNKNFIFSQDDWISVLEANENHALVKVNNLKNQVASNQFEPADYAQIIKYIHQVEARARAATLQLDFFKRNEVSTLDDLISTGSAFNTEKAIAERTAVWDDLPMPKIDRKIFEEVVEQFGTLRPQTLPYLRGYGAEIYVESINSGVFIVKNTPYSIKMLEDWYKTADNATFHQNPWDQSALNTLYINNHNNLKRNSVIINYGIFQSFARKFIKNSFVLHYLNYAAKERVSGMSYYKKLIENSSRSNEVFNEEISAFLKNLPQADQV